MPTPSSTQPAPLLSLYRVTIERTIFVMAPSARVAEDTAVRSEREEAGNSDPDSAYAVKVTGAMKIPDTWTDGLPYFAYGYSDHPAKVKQLSVTQILNSAAPE